jgi:hypothetical protein
MNYKQLEKALPASYDLPHGRPPMEGAEDLSGGFFSQGVLTEETLPSEEEYVSPLRLSQTTGEMGDEISVEADGGLSEITEVYLNGYKADFVVVSDVNLIFAIPQGATSGYVELVGPSGSLFSSGILEVV